MVEYKKNVYVFDYFLIQYKLILICDKNIGVKEFREFVEEIVMFMVYEVIRNLFLKEVEIEIFVGVVKCKVIFGRKFVIVFILCVGFGMVDGFLKLIFVVKVGYIGFYRDFEILKFVEYYCKFLQDVYERDIIVFDLMFVIGGFVFVVFDYIKRYNFQSLKFMCFIVVLEGIERLS